MKSEILLLSALLLTFLLLPSNGFTSRSVYAGKRPGYLAQENVFAGNPLQMSGKNIFEDFMDMFGFGEKANKGLNENSDEDDTPAGEFCVTTVPVQTVKQGGLRLYLMFFLLGLQNTPEPKSWRANQPSTDEFVIDFWFHDQSAVLSISLEQSQIKITRVGPNPSTAFLMQESVVVQSILDELQVMADDANVAPENRLLILKSPDTIEKARESLAFG